jgi:uncharacterized cupredoxin-like copper-binding protein
MRKRWIGLAALAMLVLATACSGGGGSSGGSGAVDVSLNEFSITPSVATAKGGQVTFDVSNDGAETHEMVVVKTDADAADIPLESGKASEKGSVGEIADLPAGQSKSLTLNLSQGHYVLLCNLPGHYTGGMRVNFTVS